MEELLCARLSAPLHRISCPVLQRVVRLGSSALLHAEQNRGGVVCVPPLAERARPGPQPGLHSVNSEYLNSQTPHTGSAEKRGERVHADEVMERCLAIEARTCRPHPAVNEMEGEEVEEEENLHESNSSSASGSRCPSLLLLSAAEERVVLLTLCNGPCIPRLPLLSRSGALCLSCARCQSSVRKCPKSPSVHRRMGRESVGPAAEVPDVNESSRNRSQGSKHRADEVMELEIGSPHKSLLSVGSLVWPGAVPRLREARVVQVAGPSVDVRFFRAYFPKTKGPSAERSRPYGCQRSVLDELPPVRSVGPCKPCTFCVCTCVAGQPGSQ
ncbi:unnamed protein product [Pleuronectes platessa]|uniref:Uncharacterized protein n=1 Tax=Pleuronectes platessa TaxID=8262 RepID=A0A9N7THA0_PLEPL|nr:unnamed protein product [Pleuronectes platessa]